MNASVEIAMALQELFDAPLTSPVDVLDGAEEVHETDAMPEDPEADPDDERVVASLRAPATRSIRLLAHRSKP